MRCRCFTEKKPQECTKKKFKRTVIEVSHKNYFNVPMGLRNSKEKYFFLHVSIM